MGKIKLEEVGRNSNEHGKLFELYIIEKFDLIGAEGNTDLWDAHTKSGKPVSIKMTNIDANSDIVLADMQKQGREVNEDFYFILGRWRESKINVVDFIVVEIDIKKWKSYFNDRALKYYEKMMEHCGGCLKGNPEDDAKWKSVRDYCGKKWLELTPNIIRPRARYDFNKKTGKPENRIQCAIRMNELKREFSSSARNYNFEKHLEDYHNFIINKKNEINETKVKKVAKKASKNFIKRVISEKSGFFDISDMEKKQVKYEEMLYEMIREAYMEEN